jgi:hypothetical protein
MKYVIAALCSLSLVASPAVFSQDKKDAGKEPSAAQKRQQERMKDCNKQAEGKNGDERKSFMSTCLKGGSEKMSAQQNKMKECNKDAGDRKLKGEERKKFMSTCLKG